jgi:hypothetical protein
VGARGGGTVTPRPASSSRRSWVTRMRRPGGTAVATGLLLVLAAAPLAEGSPAGVRSSGAQSVGTPSVSAQSVPRAAHGQGHAAPDAANGRLAPEDLVTVAGVALAPEAAAAFGRLLAAAQRDGVPIVVTDGYRSYEAQVDVKARKPHLAATPGTSQHGWGIAVDIHTGATDMAWFRANAGAYGWINPAWAQPDGSKPEPWHWEYVGDVAPPTSITPTIADGELVASVRLEPVDGPAGEWFEVREGLEDVASGARRYPGTGLPGGPGNFAVAGYQRDGGGPLDGLDDIGAGDHVRVRDADGEEHLHTVIEKVELGPEDGWAVGPDPLDDGASSLVTLTSSAGGDALTVVWAR